MQAVKWVAVVLAVVGAVNWGLVGLFDLNLVTAVLGETVLTTVVYVLVAVSGLYVAYDYFQGAQKA